MLSLRKILPLLLIFSATQSKNSVFSRIAQSHLASFPIIPEEKPIQPLTLTQQLQPWAQVKTSDRDCYVSLYKSFEHTALPHSAVFNEYGLKDLELLCGNERSEAHVLNTMPLITAFGKIYTAYLFDNPTTDHNILKARQEIIRTFASNPTLVESCVSLLEKIRDGQATTALVFNDSVESQQAFQILFYSNNWPVLKHLKSLNTSSGYQKIASLKNYLLIAASNLMMPAIAAKMQYDNPQIIPVLWKYSSTADKVKFGLYIAYIQAFALYGAYMMKTAIFDLELHLQKTLIGFTDTLRIIDTIAQLQQQYPALKNMDHANLIAKYTDPSSADLTPAMKKLINLLRKNTFRGKESYLSLHGNTRAAYALLMECRDEIHELFEIVGEIDSALASSKLISKTTNGYTFAEYVENASAPFISATDIWHPLVGAEKSVTNSIELGGKNKTNIILTGPNAGGKSTFLKGLTLNVLFAQTLGIVPAKRFVFTPFAKINTYMNIADDTAGGNSLFKSEVLRAQKLLETVKTLPAGQFSFSVMDEMFSGTSPKEGEAASYAVAEKLGSLSNSVLLLATHFPKLTELQDKTGNFKNYQVRVVQHDNGTFSYPFKLEEGKADQNIAIQILQQQGFDASILDSAQNLLSK